MELLPKPTKGQQGNIHSKPDFPITEKHSTTRAGGKEASLFLFLESFLHAKQSVQIFLSSS
ncbi:hypothetical protein FH972_027179 [Carpinus fangiana]|uniref:Uncharacterized protein n=1 Tax=Carpinus fangiana TaxID=176857 RepID=A0A5N6L6B1_9ROSI|nr:hypothetical protein FH972_027179 [Carpinus fangiana]